MLTPDELLHHLKQIKWDLRNLLQVTQDLKRQLPVEGGRVILGEPGDGRSTREHGLCVLLELVFPRAPSRVQYMQAAAGLYAHGFELDRTYGPVPLEPIPQQALEVEAALQEIVIVRGNIEESRVPEVEAHPMVVRAYRDVRIGYFCSGPFDEGGDEETPSRQGFEEGGIPPRPRSPETARGTIADVASYLGVDHIWDMGYKGQGIVIGIVDSGITAAGRVPGGRIPRVMGGFPPDWGTRTDSKHHGNMAATDALGMAPQAQIYDIRISDGDLLSGALAGFQWAIDQHRVTGVPHVLSSSWGIFQEASALDYATNPDHPFTRKVVEAINEGILVLFAAGNCGPVSPSPKCGEDVGPGRSIWGANGHPRVITVGAVDANGQLIASSSQGPAGLDPYKPDLCAVSYFRGYHPVDTGTGAACAVGSGVVALLKQARPELTQERAKAVLKRTARRIGPRGWDQRAGSGIIQAKAALDELLLSAMT